LILVTQGIQSPPQPCKCSHLPHFPCRTTWGIHSTANLHWLWTGHNTIGSVFITWQWGAFA
jgi:hypothetical protein